VKSGDPTVNDSKPADSNIKLAKDTLIYGALAFLGGKMILGHDDWCFVSEK
jgi:hypothetical protein